MAVEHAFACLTAAARDGKLKSAGESGWSDIGHLVNPLGVPFGAEKLLQLTL